MTRNMTPPRILHNKSSNKRYVDLGNLLLHYIVNEQADEKSGVCR